MFDLAWLDIFSSVFGGSFCFGFCLVFWGFFSVSLANALSFYPALFPPRHPFRGFHGSHQSKEEPCKMRDTEVKAEQAHQGLLDPFGAS